MENGQSTVRGSKRGSRKRSSQSSSNSSVVDVEEHEHAEANVQPNEQPNTFNVGTMLADMDKGLEMTGVDILDPNLNFKLNAASGQVDIFNNNIATTTGFMPTVPHTSPVSMSDFQDWRSPEDFSPHHTYQYMDWGQANNISIPGSSDSSRQSSVGTGTRDVLVRATCHPEQTKSVLEELTRAVNVMTLRGDIRSFNFAVE